MKTNKVKWLGAAAAGMLALAGRAQAIQNPAYLNIDVTITNTVSVAVGGIRVSSQAVTWSGEPVLFNVTPMAVKNDSTFFSSQWRFSTPANSLDATDGTNGWTIGATHSADQVEVQAAIGANALTDCTPAVWTIGTVTPALSNTTPITYTAAVLTETTTLGGAGAAPDHTATNKMDANSQRQLCWQLTMPTSTSFTNQQIVPIVVTAF